MVQKSGVDMVNIYHYSNDGFGIHPRWWRISEPLTVSLVLDYNWPTKNLFVIFDMLFLGDVWYLVHQDSDWLGEYRFDYIFGFGEFNVIISIISFLMVPENQSFGQIIATSHTQFHQGNLGWYLVKYYNLDRIIPHVQNPPTQKRYQQNKTSKN